MPQRATVWSSQTSRNSMKRLITLLALLLPTLCGAQSVEQLADILWHKTSCHSITAERKEAMTKMQGYVDIMTDTQFVEYYRCSEGCQKEAGLENWGILQFYNMALEKLLKEIPATEVGKGEVAVWQLYNMGYVVKTADQCFGVDIHHKHAQRVAPLIDFLLITHNHSDHQWKPLTEEMARLGKAVYSNFLDNGYKLAGGEDLKIGNIEIENWLCDHNAKARNFVTTFQVTCNAEGEKPLTFLFSGDSYSHEQLNPTRQVDVFVPHLAVGLKVNKAVEKIQPRIVLMSHILELAHHINKWRWSYQHGITECEKLNREGVYLPVWGEKITIKR